MQHPAVREAVVFGVPSEKWGETPLAAVILNKPGGVTAEALRDWINERVDAKHQRVQRRGDRGRIPAQHSWQNPQASSARSVLGRA